MKIKQIVGEHKKGFRAKKYARKPTNTIAPKKPEPIKAQGPVGPGDIKVNEGADLQEVARIHQELMNSNPQYAAEVQAKNLSLIRGIGPEAQKHNQAVWQQIAMLQQKYATVKEDDLEEMGTMADAKIVANDGKTITVALPDGTQIQKPMASALSKDEQGNDVFNIQTKTAAGAPAQPEQSPEQKFKPGSDISVNTGEPIEEEGGDENDPSLATASTPEVNQQPEPTPVAERQQRGSNKSNIELESMLRIAGLR